jgi:hypothetical protein
VSLLGLALSYWCQSPFPNISTPVHGLRVDVSYAAPQAHEIVNVALHREYSPGIVFKFSRGRKDLYHV